MATDTLTFPAPNTSSPLQQAMQASKQHAPADDLLSGLQTHAADFQAELVQSILDQTRGDGYDRKTHLAPLMPLRRGMEITGQGTAVDIRNTLLIVTQLKALVWAQAALAKSTNPLERSIYDWRYHMDLVTAFNVETGILQQQLAYQQQTRSFN
jgi:hypothetical protein